MADDLKKCVGLFLSTEIHFFCLFTQSIFGRKKNERKTRETFLDVTNIELENRPEIVAIVVQNGTRAAGDGLQPSSGADRTK